MSVTGSPLTTTITGGDQLTRKVYLPRSTKNNLQVISFINLNGLLI